MNLSYEVACSSMTVIANIGRAGLLAGLGIAKPDFDKLVGSEPWQGSDRNRMTVLLHNLINAGVDSIGAPRFPLPAEYIAAGIVMFVHGVNVMTACLFAPQGLQGAEDMGRGVVSDPVTPQQLFAICLQLFDSPTRSSAKILFDKKVGLALEKVSGKVGGQA